MKFTRDLRPKEGNCFVIMPFGSKPLKDGRNFDWDAHYKEVIAPSIHDAGMTAVRADDIFGSQPLMERIWKGIQEAELIVADLTGRSPNVLYELGLAHVIWKRVILLTMDETDIPSDLAHYVQIRYTDAGRGLLQLDRDLKENLKAARAEPKAEAALYPLPGGGIEIVPAKVIAVRSDFVTVETSEGRIGILRREDVSWTRILPDLTKKFTVGQQLNGAFVVDVKGDTKYSLIATEDDPWPRTQTEFSVGHSFTGKVVNRAPKIGVFVAMKYGINGLIPESTIPHSDALHLEANTEVEAIVVKIDPARRMVELRFARIVKMAGPVENPSAPHLAIGTRFLGRVVHIHRPNKDYALIALPDGNAAMLHISRMSPRLTDSIVQDETKEESMIPVEVCEVRGGRVFLRDTSDEVSDGE